MRRSSILCAIVLTVFGGCSSHFEHYTPSSEHEKATSSYQNVRLLNDSNNSEAIISTIYLNEVYPDYTDGYAHFLIAFYHPEDENALYFKRSERPDDKAFILLLNGEEALAYDSLDRDDLLVSLMPISNHWSHYYYVRYRLPSGTPVLVLESDHTEKAVITYQKEQQ